MADLLTAMGASFHGHEITAWADPKELAWASSIQAIWLLHLRRVPIPQLARFLVAMRDNPDLAEACEVVVTLGGVLAVLPWAKAHGLDLDVGA